MNRDYKRILERNNDILDKVKKGITDAFTSVSGIKGKIRNFTFYNPSLFTRTEIYNITIGSQYVEFYNKYDEVGEIIDNYQLDKTKF